MSNQIIKEYMLDNFGDTEINLVSNPFGIRSVYFDKNDDIHICTSFHEIWQYISQDTKCSLVYDLLKATKESIINNQ
jgi:hypothetical protein